jgi:ATP-dependent RNA helicase DeaD
MQDPSSFEDLNVEIPDDVLAGIRDLGWQTPMPVQTRVIPPLREGNDLIVQARTGSGKTGAFGIPIVSSIDPSSAVTQALVLLPTRELANQVAREVETMGKHRGVRCLPIYGGVGYGPQNEGLAEGAHVVVGTPGRILDHLGAGRLVLDRVQWFVLDEADELLSLGFWPDMREIHKHVPQKRQSCLFSATIPERVRSLSRVFLHDPEFVTLSEGQVGPSEIEHYYIVTSAQEKDANLIRLLEHEVPESALIFCNTKSDVRYVTAYLQRKGFDADQISGDLTQVARERAMALIKAGELRILVATDVAARGIDISDLSHVISYSTPDSPEVYIHRTGRTGRAGKAGTAISLVSGLDIGNFRAMQRANKIEVAERTLPTDKELLGRVRERLKIKVEQDVRELPDSERAVVDQLIPVVEELAQSSEGLRDLSAVCHFFLREHRPETRVAETPEPARPPEPRKPAREEAPRRPGGRPRGQRRRPRRGGGR